MNISSNRAVFCLEQWRDKPRVAASPCAGLYRSQHGIVRDNGHSLLANRGPATVLAVRSSGPCWSVSRMTKWAGPELELNAVLKSNKIVSNSPRSMGDAPASDAESKIQNPVNEVPPEPARRPFGGLEFQVSEVVGRLEAGVNAQDALDEEKKRETRKISAGFFEPEEMPMDEILKVLEDLVLKTDHNCESVEPPLLPTDAVTRATILSHSICALFGRLERSHAARLGAHIASETTRWMAHMFRLADYNAYYHHEHLEGLVRVTRMLLHHRYPRYLEDGALAFTNRLPCIYSCVASPLGIVQHLCRQLGLPLACVRPVPVNGTGKGMDIQALERLCDEDVVANRTPLLVLGEVGAPPLGWGTPLAELGEICTKRNIHLHVRGHALALPAATGRNQSFSLADSVTLTPGPWFGVPGLPTVVSFIFIRN
ncbi:unnamed protein product [Diatraea saccharalis]|uniref:Uncharacterized protein n=1 Tax=Diatraea saccharalis TaxID=40085 RepID=A0A9N9W8W7_9NEOP|nr:unnamed protein product [Diatraea saccharalis]